MTHPYDGCPACIDEHVRKLNDPPPKTRRPAPTVEALERHAALFGPEGVAEMAEAHGLTLGPLPAPKRRPRRRRR